MSNRNRRKPPSQRSRGPVVFLGRPEDWTPEFIAQALILSGGHFKPGTFHHFNVMHDPDCRRPQGGPCTCNPDVELPGDPERN